MATEAQRRANRRYDAKRKGKRDRYAVTSDIGKARAEWVEAQAERLGNPASVVRALIDEKMAETLEEP